MIFTDRDPTADVEKLVEGESVCAEDGPGERVAAAHDVVNVLVLSM